MIPAKMSCPSGWTREYYLMSEYIGHRRTEYICVDSNMESYQEAKMTLVEVISIMLKLIAMGWPVHLTITRKNSPV